MKFLFLYYGYLENSGRAKEIMATIKSDYDLIPFTLSNSKLIHKLSKYRKRKFYRSKAGFLLFLLEGVYFSLKTRKSIDGLVICDGAATILGTFLVNLGFKNKFIIQDFVEFYEEKNFKNRPFSKLVLMFERLFIKHSELMVCANDYRSRLMLEKYKLDKSPFVFENIWTLSSIYTNNSHLIKHLEEPSGKEKLQLIYTGAINTSSQFIDLLNAVITNSKICQIRIAGNVTSKTIDEIKKCTINNKFFNIEFIGLLSHEELRLELKKSHAGFIFYPFDTLNNIYCAPGKLHEYLFEGLPIITSSNPPLKEFTENHGVGISNDNFVKAIQWMYTKYDDCKKNINKYISENNNIISENRKKLMDAINSAIESRKHSHD